MDLIQADVFLGGINALAQVLDLLGKCLLSLSGSLQFLLDESLLGGVQDLPFDVLLEFSDAVSADTGLQEQGAKARFQNLGKAAQFLANCFCFSHKSLEDLVLGTLAVEEIAAVDLLGGLKLAVYAPIALLHASRVPGHINMEEIPTMAL